MKASTNRLRDAGEDLVFLWRLRGGDPAVLRKIYEKYREDLLKIGLCLLGDRSTAEDALHDVFVALAEGRVAMRVGMNLKRYLSVALANRARDALRRQAVRNGVSTGILEASGVPSSSPEPCLQIMQREEADAVRQALAQLPYDQREVITLHLHGSLTFRQIARDQQISINTVMSRYRYGLARLRSTLTEGFVHEAQ